MFSTSAVVWICGLSALYFEFRVMAKVMTLEIWSGGWGLPSVDQRCLETMAFARFSGVPLKLERSNNPFWSSNGRLPVFRHGNTVLHSSQDIMIHFRKENYSAEYMAEGYRIGDVLAYESMVRNRLNPGILFTWWVDERNYTEVIRPTFAKKLPLPFNYFYPGHYHRKAKEELWLMHNLRGETPSEEELNWRIIEKNAYKMAVDCLNLLSAKLGDNEFFSGSSPRFVDAVIFSYLAPLLKVPLPKSSLQVHLKACPNLVDFVNRVLQRYFPPTPEDKAPGFGGRIVVREDSGKTQAGGDDDGNDRRLKNFLVCFAAMMAMGVYAIYAGHVYVNVKRKPIADIEILESAVGDFYEPSEDGDQT